MAEVKRKSYTSTYGSLAYDLDAIVRERQLDEAGTMPERRPQIPAQPKTRTQTHAKTKARPSSLVLGGVVTLCALVLVLMLGYVQLTKVSNHVSSIKNEISALTDEHVSLLTEYEKTFDLATVKAVAERAGMSKPSAGQIEYIDLSGSDSVVIYRAEAPGVLQDLRAATTAAAAKVWEYFR